MTLKAMKQEPIAISNALIASNFRETYLQVIF